jgi:hypothetical protein
MSRPHRAQGRVKPGRGGFPHAHAAEKLPQLIGCKFIGGQRRGGSAILGQASKVLIYQVILLKWLYDESSARRLELSPQLTGLIAAEVFIVGFMLAGTTGDFKEAECLPGELAASLETVADGA